MKNHILKIVYIILALVAINWLASYWHFSVDLTQDKRFTLSIPTKKVLKSLENDVTIRVLLEGDFPAQIKRLQKSVQELGEDFSAQNGRVQFYFEDPTKTAPAQLARTQRILKMQGISPFNLREGKRGEQSEKLIFPVAIVEGLDTIAVNLLDNQVAGTPEEVVINNSISQLEYRLADAIKRAVFAQKRVIAFTAGRGELTPIQTFDLEYSLRKSYFVGRLHLDSIRAIDPKIEVLIVAKPRFTFNEKDKFLIDQYVMNGGKVIWLIDRLTAELDSMRQKGIFVPSDYPINLEDILYKYGVRIQPNLVLDMDCTQIPLQTGMAGDKPQYDAFNWYYYPLVRPFSQHPIVKNLDRVQLKFASSIDTIKTKTDVTKTLLLKTSEYSNEQFSPVELNFEILRKDPDKKAFNKANLPVAVLLEGVFPSLYANRARAEWLDILKERGLTFKNESVPTQMLVVADGDMAANPILKERPLYLGQDEISGYIYGNKDFLQNAIAYMLDDAGLFLAKNKEVKLRLLDKQRIADESVFWQLLNVLLPIIILAAFGMWYVFMRKRKYGR